MISRGDLEGLAPDFLEWLDEVEVFSSLWERLFWDFDLDKGKYKLMVEWLYAAYRLGYDKGKSG